MSNSRVITKVLAGLQDLLLGEGTVNQKRGNGSYTIDKIRLLYPANNREELSVLDPGKVPKARLYLSKRVHDLVFDTSEYKLVSRYNSVAKVNIVNGSASLEDSFNNSNVETVSYNSILALTVELDLVNASYIARADLVGPRGYKYVVKHTGTTLNTFEFSFIDTTTGLVVDISSVPELNIVVTIEPV